VTPGVEIGRAPVAGCATTVCDVQRLCERPGCGAPSDASYGIDRLNLVVWVDTAAVAERETAGRLCRRHANALMVPRGWTLDDRRDPVPRLFKVREPGEQPGDAPPGKKRERKQTGGARPRRRPPPGDTPGLFESIRREIDTAPAGDSPAAPATRDAADPEETQAMPWSPRLASQGNTAGLPRPQFGRLLGRAFGDAADDNTGGVDDPDDADDHP
jgi:hypothetical protein